MFLSSAPVPSTGRDNSRGESHGARHVATRAAKHHGRVPDHHRHRVVAARHDLAVVHEEQVRDLPQAAQRVVIAVCEGLVGQVARRHDERQAALGQQEVVERCVGQEHAEQRAARRDVLRDRCAGLPPGEHDGPLHGLEQREDFPIERDEGGRCRSVTHHDGERLLVPVLARAQPPHRLR